MTKVFTDKSLGFTNAEGGVEEVGIGFGQVSDSCRLDSQFQNALLDGSLKVFESAKEGDKIEKGEFADVTAALSKLTNDVLKQMAAEKGIEIGDKATKKDYVAALSSVVTIDEIEK